MKKQLEPFQVMVEREHLRAIRHIAIDADVSPGVIVRDAIGEYLARQKHDKGAADRFGERVEDGRNTNV